MDRVSILILFFRSQLYIYNNCMQDLNLFIEVWTEGELGTAFDHISLGVQEVDD